MSTWTFPLVMLLAVVLPASAAAQQAAPSAGPLRVESVENGFAIAPDTRFTSINDEFATLAGVYGGWVTDRTLLVGAGGYWLANRDDDFKMQYFGGLARWTFGGHRRLGISTGALVGLGDATLSRTYGDLFGDRIDTAPRGTFSRHGRVTSPITSATRVRVSDDFFIAEPQVSALWNLTPWMRIDAGVSYRLIGGADLLDDELRGASGTIGIQFGGR